jgi:hypothetical protein
MDPLALNPGIIDLDQMRGSVKEEEKECFFAFPRAEKSRAEQSRAEQKTPLSQAGSKLPRSE